MIAQQFNSFAEIRVLSEEWRMDYNSVRLHKSLGYLSPLMYTQMKKAHSALSTPEYGNHLKIVAQPVVDKAVEAMIITVEL